MTYELDDARAAWEESGRVRVRVFCAGCNVGRAVAVVRESSKGLVFRAIDLSEVPPTSATTIRRWRSQGVKGRIPFVSGAGEVLVLLDRPLDSLIGPPRAWCSCRGVAQLTVDELQSAANSNGRVRIHR